MWQPTDLKTEESGYNKDSKTRQAVLKSKQVQVIQQKTLII